MSRFLFGASLLVAGLPVACGENPLRPEQITGDYFLESVNSLRLPVILAASESCYELLEGGTLSLDDGAFTLQLRRQTDCTRGGGGVDESQDSSVGSYDLNGRTITLTVSSGPLAGASLSGSPYPPAAIDLHLDHASFAMSQTGEIELFFTRPTFVPDRLAAGRSASETQIQHDRERRSPPGPGGGRDL